MKKMSLRIVFPTPVGVFLRMLEILPTSFSLPHARGGVRTSWSGMSETSTSSPRPWGCFSPAGCRRGGDQVFPTPVGVFLSGGETESLRGGLPHARGGVSAPALRPFASPSSSPRPWGCFSGGKPGLLISKSSPRPWGCFLKKCLSPWTEGVFPTPVGVFLEAEREIANRYSLPHARGGVSGHIKPSDRSGESSPRPWGCF